MRDLEDYPRRQMPPGCLWQAEVLMSDGTTLTFTNTTVDEPMDEALLLKNAEEALAPRTAVKVVNQWKRLE